MQVISFCTPMTKKFSVASLTHLCQDATYFLNHTYLVTDILDVMRDVPGSSQTSLEYKSRLRWEVRNHASTLWLKLFDSRLI